MRDFTLLLAFKFQIHLYYWTFTPWIYTYQKYSISTNHKKAQSIQVMSEISIVILSKKRAYKVNPLLFLVLTEKPSFIVIIVTKAHFFSFLVFPSREIFIQYLRNSICKECSVFVSRLWWNFLYVVIWAHVVGVYKH